MYRLYGRTIIDHLAKHIPGTPKIVIQYMPGSGGYKAANFLYIAAPPSGPAGRRLRSSGEAAGVRPFRDWRSSRGIPRRGAGRAA